MTPGETLHFKDTEKYCSPHCHGLFLGKDREGDKVLLPTYVAGYKIANLSEIPIEAYRPAGKCNIKAEKKLGKDYVSFQYMFFDIKNGKDFTERIVEVEMQDGLWQIVSRSSDPNWKE